MENESLEAVHTFSTLLEIAAKPQPGSGIGLGAPAFGVSIAVKARRCWALAVCSAVSPAVLDRYFSLNAGLLFQLMTRLGEDQESRDTLGGLADHLLEHYGGYINTSLRLPPVYIRLRAARLRWEFSLVLSALGQAVIDTRLKTWLVELWAPVFGERIRQDLPLSYLLYVEGFVLQLLVSLTGVSDTGPQEEIIRQLMAHDFNHLGFLGFIQERVSRELVQQPMPERACWIRRHPVFLFAPLDSALRYDPLWPSLGSMLKGWMDEEVGIAEAAIAHTVAVGQEKLPLGMSVAHLGCLLRLFFEQKIFATTSLHDIFKFAAAHLQTVRQDSISPGSLSKEYYSVSQKTAAVVRDMLQQMLLRVNRKYFPVMAVISVMLAAR